MISASRSIFLALTRLTTGLVRLRINKAIPELIRLLFMRDDWGPISGGPMGEGGSGDEARAWVPFFVPSPCSSMLAGAWQSRLRVNQCSHMRE